MSGFLSSRALRTANDQCWLKDGNWSGNHTQQMPEEGVAPSQKTGFKILFDDANIYVAIRAHDTEPEKIDFRPADILMLKLNYWFSL